MWKCYWPVSSCPALSPFCTEQLSVTLKYRYIAGTLWFTHSHVTRSNRPSKHPQCICPCVSPPLLTSIWVCLCSVSVLEPVVPRPLVLPARPCALPQAVASLKAVRPLAFVHPSAFILDTHTVSLALSPGALVGVPAGPSVDAQQLEAMGPGPAVLALALGSRTDPVAVRLALLPPSAVWPPIVKVEPAASGHAWNRSWQFPWSLNKKKKKRKRKWREEK